MSDKSGIQWTDATWNPVSGCTRVSAGCDHCYAVKQTHRLEAMGQAKYKGLTVLNPRGDRHFNGQVQLHYDAIRIPLKWRRGRRIFVNSMSDLFHEKVPFDFVDMVFAVMGMCPQHTFQVLTKRPERMAEYLTIPNNRECLIGDRMISENGDTAYLHLSQMKAGGMRLARWPLPNVWLGTSAEDQPTADERIPHLLRCPAAVRFLSGEPLLGPVHVLPHLSYLLFHCSECGRELRTQFCQKCGTDDNTASNEVRQISWVIVGGESGKGARPCDVAWVRSIVGQCKDAGVPVFVKQLGSEARIGYYDDFREVHEDRGFQWPDPVGWKCERDGQPRMDAVVELFMSDPKGGDMAEWPEDLRVREMPGVRA